MSDKVVCLYHYVGVVAYYDREGPRENWEKVQVLWICRAVGVFPSRVIWDEYRN